MSSMEESDLPDIYDYEGNYNACLNTIKNSEKICEENKKALFSFDEKTSEISDRTTQKHLYSLYRALKEYNCPDSCDQDGDWTLEDSDAETILLFEADSDDITDLSNAISDSDASSSYRRAMKLGIQKFYKTIFPDDYPSKVDRLDTSVTRNDEKKRVDVLSPEEVQQIVSECKNARDKCLVKLLYESAMRIGELLTLQIRDINFEDRCAEVNIRDGRTGERTIYVVESQRYLRSWLDQHPMSNDRKAPLFTKKFESKLSEEEQNEIDTIEDKRQKMRISYHYARRVLKEASIRADIRTYEIDGEKKTDVHPHLLRHSRATEYSKTMSESKLKKYMGWSRQSSMTEIYLHLDSDDTKNAVLDHFGMKSSEEKEEVSECPRCSTEFKGIENFCPKCGSALSSEVAVKMSELENASDDMADKRLEGYSEEDLLQKMKELESKVQELS